MLADFINTMLELSSVLFTYLILTQIPLRKFNIFLYFILSIPLSLLFASIDNPISFINFTLIAILQIITLHHALPLTERCLFSAITFLLVGYLEFMAYSLMPASWLQTDFAHYISNIPIMIITSCLYYISRRFHISNILRTYVIKFKFWILGLLLFTLFLGQSYLSRLSTFWTYLPGFVTLCIFLLIVFIIAISIHYSRSADRLRANAYEKHAESLDQFMHLLRKNNHDYKHHIHHITNQIETAADLQTLRADIRDYVQQLDADRSVASQLQSIEQPLFRSVLYGAYLRCQTENIPVSLTTTDLLPAFPLKDYQLVEVLENLLSNAIEHNLKLEPENRSLTISLSVCCNGLLQENTCTITNSVMPTFTLEDLKSTSKHTSNSADIHGVGLASVKEILADYHIPLYVQLNAEQHLISFSFSYSDSERTL